ncbi:MAG: hypothetical protein U5M23_02265 [Marinagarivorans sp.]|nr:hypothetical protein [Marinagarivorans sp.]
MSGQDWHRYFDPKYTFSAVKYKLGNANNTFGNTTSFSLSAYDSVTAKDGIYKTVGFSLSDIDFNGTPDLAVSRRIIDAWTYEQEQALYTWDFKLTNQAPTNSAIFSTWPSLEQKRLELKPRPIPILMPTVTSR